MNEIRTSGPLLFTEPNSPTRVGEIINTLSEIYDIPMPRLGMSVYVKDEGVNYTVTKLESKLIEGVLVPDAKVAGYELQTGKSIAWNSSSNVNDYVVAGVYNITGERLNVNDGLPIANSNPGHTISARLVVLDSSISGSGRDDDKCITQVLSFSNRLGQGEVYIRTGKGSSLDNLTWENWSTLQRNVNVDTVTSLDHLVDNGIYSGVLAPTGETFVLVVINNYALASKYGTQKCISQFKYSVNPFGAISFGKRVKIENADFPAEWDILNKNEIDKMLEDAVAQAIASVTDSAPEAFDTLRDIADWITNDKTGAVALANAISANTAAITAERIRAIRQEDLLNNAIVGEKTRAEQAEQVINKKLDEEIDRSVAADQDLLRGIDEEERRATEAEDAIKSKAVEADNLNFLTRANEVALDYKTIDGTGDEATIPAATTESAGVMSAEDKRLIAACNSYLVNDASNLQDAINALSNIIPNENKNSGVIVNFVDENGSLRSFVFSSNVGGFTNPVRWIDIAGNQTYIVDDKPANYYRLSELIKNIKVQATGEFDVNATYSIGQFGYAPSFGSNIVEIKRDGEILGIIYFNNSLVGELDASNLKIIVSVKSFRETTGVFDYSQYNRINPQLFTDAYESWKLNATEAVANKNTTAIAVVADVIYESDIVAVDTMVQQGKYYNNLGRFVDDSARCCTMPFDVAAGERYYITCRIGGSTVIAYVAMWGADGEWLGVADGFIGGSGNAVDRVFIVPEGVEKVALSSYNTTAPTLKKLVHGDSTAFYTKNETYNRDEIDTLISNSPGGGGGSDVDSNINNVETISFNVEDNAITEAVLLGTGWSGNLINGYSHTSGNTEPLEFDLPYASLEKFILEFKCDGVKGDSTDLLIAVGDTPTVKSYNGGTEFRIGFVANGGRLKINPANNFASTITDIAIRKISNNGNSTITINVGDVYSQANAMITAFWNVAIGSNNMTLSKLINGSRNVAIGRNTLNAATSGNRNIAIGTFAMPFLTEAEENVAIGADTIYPLTKAIGCVGIGKATLSGTQKAEYCVAIGKSAMGTYGLAKDRTKCTAIGVSAGPSITDSCTHVGYRAGANVAGAKNTSIGYGSMAVGERSTVDITGEELTCIGYYSQIDNTEEAKSAKNSTAIGANTKITKSNQVVIGNANVEEVVIVGKKIIFYEDGTVKWENI